MKFRVSHKTSYKYSTDVSSCYNLAVMTPKSFHGQELLESSLHIDPKPDSKNISQRQDFFGNKVTRFALHEVHKSLEVEVISIVNRNFDQVHQSYSSPQCTNVTLAQAKDIMSQPLLSFEDLDAKQYVLDSTFIKGISEDIKNYAKQSLKLNRSLFEGVEELVHRIFTDFTFSSGVTNISTPINEVMRMKKGVCQDFAQFAIACIRSLGIPARYVSGYIETLPPEGEEKLVGVDASHAWFAVYIPSFGWVEFDPTNNQIPLNQHIVVGWGRDYYDLPPMKGIVYTSGKSKMKVAVDIQRIS